MSDEVPDTWPPGDATPSVHRFAPLFPLPKVFLYPGTLMPLHVFEPRYRQMVDDLLDRPGLIVICSIQGGHEGEALGAPPVYPVGGLGEIVRHARLPDGRYLITLAGLARVRVREVESDRLYRKVEFEVLHEVQPTDEAGAALAERLRQAILSHSETFLDLPADMPPGPLTDLLLQTLDLPVDQLQEVYAEPEVAVRAQRALAEYEARS